MASIIPNSLLRDEATGAVGFDTDSFKVVLLTSSYTPNKDTHTKRSDLTNEVSASGTYVAGGLAATVTVGSVDTANDRVDISLGGVTITGSPTITARYAAYYKARGGASSADELVFINDFGSDVTSTAATFTLAASTLRKQN